MTPTTQGQRAILYIRQSKARDDSISSEIQESEGRAHAARHGYEIVRVVSDPGVSGYRDWTRRPNFPEVLSTEGDVVVVYRWSRLSRRRLDQAVLIDLLEKSGKRVESACEPADPSTAGGRLARDQMLLIAAFESDVKSEQWKEALARRATAGLPKNGLPRFGYVKVAKGYQPDPVTGPELAEVYRRYTAGAGFQQLVRDLNDRAVPTTRGNTWCTQSLIRTLDSGFGAGLLICDKRSGTPGFLSGAQAAVITKAEWIAYQDARARRRVEPPARRTARWFLSGIVRCGRCGSSVAVNKFETRKSTVLCSRYVNKRDCDGVWMSRHNLEGRIAVWLGGHLDELAALAPTRDAERGRAQGAVTAAQDAHTAAVSALGTLAANHSRGLHDEDAYTAAQAELVAERDALTARLAAARDELVRLSPVDESVYAQLESSTEQTPGEWNGQLAKLIRRVEVHKDRLVIVPVVGEPEVDPR